MNTAASAQDSSANLLTQDLVALLKALASGDTAGAKNDLAKLESDLKTGATPATSSVTKDLTALLKDLGSGDTAAAKADVTQLATDVKAEETASGGGSASSTQTPLDKLVSQLSTLLGSGSTDSALQAVAKYLVDNGQGTGSLVDTTV